jgi:hypothetical protein
MVKLVYITQETSPYEGKPTIQGLASRYKTHHTYSSDYYSFPDGPWLCYKGPTTVMHPVLLDI